MSRRAILVTAAVVLTVAVASLPEHASAQSIDRIVILSGSRTNGVVRMALTRKRRELRECLQGTLHMVSLQLRVDPAGSVVDATGRSDGPMRETIDCLERVARTLALPASESETRARVNLSLTGLGGAPERWRRPAETSVVQVPPATSIEGWLRRDHVRRVLLRSANQLRHCYEQVHRDLEASALPDGELVLRVVVGPTGSVASVEVVSSTLERGDVAACVSARLRAFPFPPVADFPEAPRPEGSAPLTRFEQRILFGRRR